MKKLEHWNHENTDINVVIDAINSLITDSEAKDKRIDACFEMIGELKEFQEHTILENGKLRKALFTIAAYSSPAIAQRVNEILTK